MSVILRGALRSVKLRKLETLFLVVIIALTVAFHGSMVVLSENMAYQVYIQMKEHFGHVLLGGLFDEEADRLVEEIPGVASVRSWSIWFGIVEVDGNGVMVSLVAPEELERLAALRIEGRLPSAPGEAVYYRSLSGPPGEGLGLGIGDTVDLRAFTPEGRPVTMKLRIVGVAEGYAHLGGLQYSLVLSSNDMQDIVGDNIIVLGITAEEDDPRLIDSIAEESVDRLRAAGYHVAFIFVNKPGENPVIVFLQSAMNLLTTLSLATLGIAAAIPVAVGSAQVVREARIIAALKAQGAPSLHVALLYIVPWLVRAAIGALLGAVLAPPLARFILERFIMGGSDFAERLFQLAPFQPYPLETAKSALVAFAVVMLASLVPGLIAARVDPLRALSFVGLTGASRIVVPLPSARLSLHLREPLSRPWRLAGTALAVAVAFAVAIAGAGLSAGLSEVTDFYRDTVGTDVIVYAVSMAPGMEVDVIGALRSVLTGQEELYLIHAQRDLVGLFGLGEFSRVTAFLEGDPWLAYPLSEGRYPEAPGEAVLSVSVAGLLGVGVGDRVHLKGTAGEGDFTIVGLTLSRDANGFLAIVTQSDYEKLTGSQPGGSAAVLRVDLKEGVDPDEYGRRAVSLLERNWPLDAEYVTRSDVVEGLESFRVVVEGVLTVVTGIAALIAGLAASGVLIADIYSRSKEIAVLYSLGIKKLELLTSPALTVLVSALISLGLSIPAAIILLDVLSRRTALALGYVEPRLGLLIEGVGPQIIVPLAVAFIIGVIAAFIAIRRLDIIASLKE